MDDQREATAQHADETCWCRPRVEDRDGVRVIVHKTFADLVADIEWTTIERERPE